MGTVDPGEASGMIADLRLRIADFRKRERGSEYAWGKGAKQSQSGLPGRPRFQISDLKCRAGSEGRGAAGGGVITRAKQSQFVLFLGQKRGLVQGQSQLCQAGDRRRMGWGLFRETRAPRRGRWTAPNKANLGDRDDHDFKSQIPTDGQRNAWWEAGA